MNRTSNLPTPVQQQIDSFIEELLIFQRRRRTTQWLNTILTALLLVNGFFLFAMNRSWAFDAVPKLAMCVILLIGYTIFVTRPHAQRLKRAAKDLQGLFDRDDDPMLFDIVEKVVTWRCE